MTEKTAFPIAPHSLKPKQVEIRPLKRNLYIYEENPYKETYIYIKRDLQKNPTSKQPAFSMLRASIFSRTLNHTKETCINMKRDRKYMKRRLRFRYSAPLGFSFESPQNKEIRSHERNLYR